MGQSSYLGSPGGALVSNFAFLQAEWPFLHDEAVHAEQSALTDPRAACFYARRTLELALDWLYQADDTLRLPYRDDLRRRSPSRRWRRWSDLRSGRRWMSSAVRAMRRYTGERPCRQGDAVRVVSELFHVLYWLAGNYARDRSQRAGGQPDVRPSADSAARVSGSRIRRLWPSFSRWPRSSRARRRSSQQPGARIGISMLRSSNCRQQIKAAKAANAGSTDTHDYNEAETRRLIIDLLLKEAGWDLDKPEDREFPVTGMPTPSGTGKVDYVLWDNDGKPIGLVEAKRTINNAKEGQHQAKLYADSLQAKYGQRPVIFYTNGYKTYIWDDLNYPPREIQGFYTKDELRLAIQRRSSRQALDGYTHQ